MKHKKNTAFLLFAMLLLFVQCTKDTQKVNGECGIDFYNIALQDSYEFNGSLTLCHKPDPNYLALHIQDASVNFISYEKDTLAFQFSTSDDFFNIDTTFIYPSLCLEGDDDPDEEDDEFHIYIYNDVDTFGTFRRTTLQFNLYLDFEIFGEECFPNGADAYFTGKL